MMELTIVGCHKVQFPQDSKAAGNTLLNVWPKAETGIIKGTKVSHGHQQYDGMNPDHNCGPDYGSGTPKQLCLQ